MPGKKRLVVDASVTGAASDKPVPGSAQCRAVLEAILAARHRVAFSAEGWAEWRNHRSEFARRWLVRMHARKLPLHLTDVRDPALRKRLRRCVSDKDWQQLLEKDCHLVETALKVDRIVISRDETARGLFRQACSKVAELREVLWANPEIEEERVVDWLRSGAKAEQGRGLAPLVPSG